ncbi:MAG: cellulose synthase subunit BcsC-related outer membrane protein [Nevskia sp.]|nr:cellulose synthase subunit BcsC-related outer membrane protein [Nevskia sp.]
MVWLLPILLAAGHSLPAQAQPDRAALGALVEQGRYWEGREQYGRAREAWQRVVDADPGNVEALGRLVSLAARQNDKAGARQYLDRLRTAAPGSAALKQAEALISGSDSRGAVSAADSAAALARARAAAAAQDYPTALAAYREAFGGEPTGGPNAMEYYQTLGATEAGWAPAERWLRGNAARNPNDSAAALALAQHLTYRERTRREGIDKLAALSTHPTAALRARKSQRQALLWLEGKPADAGRYRAWLATDDKDTEIRAKLDGLDRIQRGQARAVYGARVGDLFRQVDGGDIAGAEAGFADILKASPGNADALGGMGVIRLRQQRYEESKSYLDKARAASPGSAGRWREALTAATFWSRVQVAEKARLASDYPAADAAYVSALSAPPSEVPDSVRLAHADVLLNRGKDREAEAIARSALKRDDQNPDALAVLLTVLSRSGRDAEALQLSRRVPAKLRPQVATLRADELRRRAKLARDGGDLAQSERLLNDALLEAPTNPWIRLDLSEVYRKQNRRAEAATLLDGLATSHGRNRDVRLAQAYFDAEQKDWAGVLNRLETFTAAERSADAIGLQRRAWVQYQLERARIALRRGHPGDAHRILTDTDLAAAGDPELQSALASGWAELQDPARAVAYMRRSMGQVTGDGRSAPPALRAQYAALLLSAGQDAEFEVVAADLAARKDLDPAGQAALDELVIGYRIKLADRARSEKRYPEAYLQLRDAVARYPANVQVQMALARLLTDAHDIDAATSIYQSLAQREPDDNDIRLGLVDTLLAGDRRVAAGREIDRGLSVDEANPRWWRASGRLAEQENRKGAALKAYRRAEALERESPAEQPAPQLAWIDPRQPGVALPAAVAQLLAETSPDAPGPLPPRATGVAAAPAVQAAVNRAGTPGLLAGAPLGLRPSSTLGSDGVGPWQAAQVGQPLWLKLSDAEAPKGKPAADEAGVYPIAPGPVARLESSTSGWVGGETAIRSRKGEGGLSQLFDLETPVTLNLPETSFGQASLTATPVYIDSGTASGQRLLRIGAGALVGGTETGTRDAGGVAFGLGYKLGDFRADIGVTPIGFEVERLVGGLSWRYSPDDLRLGVEVSRRAVSESLLAYAGAKDPLLGRVFGGVARTGGRVDVALDTGRFGLYGYGGYYSYDGRNVETNASLLGGAGVFGRTALAVNHGLTYGLNLTVFSFDDNRRFYTFGHGGYFSPQLFTAVTVPVQWAGVAGPLSWNISAAFGVQSFREDGAPYYPGFDALQAELERVVALNPDPTLATGYASQRSTGLGYTAKALSEYRVAPRLTVGGLFSIDNARNFRELQAHGYLRWYFSPQPPEATDPAPILPFYQY